MAKSPGLRFKKSGREIKVAVGALLEQLQSRLTRRGLALDEFLNNRQLVRSYLIRAIGGRVRYRNPEDGSSLHSESEISSEQMEEIKMICERIYVIELEIRRLQLVVKHLSDDEVFELNFAQLASYGFEP